MVMADNVDYTVFLRDGLQYSPKRASVYAGTRAVPAIVSVVHVLINLNLFQACQC